MNYHLSVIGRKMDFQRIGYLRPKLTIDTRREEDFKLRYNYIPHVPVVQKLPIPSASELINSPLRFHLQSQESNRPLAWRSNPAIRSSLDDCDTPPSEYGVDLGVVALQRIVNQLRGLQSKGRAHVFDPLAAKAAGLPPYTDYLNEHRMHKPRQPNKLRKSLNEEEWK